MTSSTTNITSSETKSKLFDKKEEWINHPSHYNGHKMTTAKGEVEYETIDLLTSVANRYVKDHIPADATYCVCNALKYIERCGEKAGDYGKDQKAKNIEDLNKAVWYLNKAIKLYENTK